MEKNTIGQLLTDARNEKNITLEEVANKTKININILRSLEADDLKKLPNKTYVKGFVQNYARVVGLNVDVTVKSLIDTYEQQSPSETHQDEELIESETVNELTPEQLETREKLVNLVHNFLDRKTILTFSAIVLGIFLVRGIINFFTKVSNEKVQVTKTEPKIKPSDSNLFEMEATKKLQEANKIEEVKEDIQEEEKDEIKEEPKEEITEEADKVKEEISQLPEGKFPFKKFYPAPPNMYEVLPNAEENFDNNLIPLNFRESVVADKENIFIHATEGDSWISYQTDNDKIKRFVLKKGRHIMIRGDVILLFMGNATASKIFYNNQLVKFDTSSGVKSFIFPKDKIKNYELPLFPTFKGVPYSAKDYKEKMIKE